MKEVIVPHITCPRILAQVVEGRWGNVLHLVNLHILVLSVLQNVDHHGHCVWLWNNICVEFDIQSISFSCKVRERSHSFIRQLLGSNRSRQALLKNRHCGIKIADRKSTRLNSSHVAISYAVFCLKKKN